MQHMRKDFNLLDDVLKDCRFKVNDLGLGLYKIVVEGLMWDVAERKWCTMQMEGILYVTCRGDGQIMR